MKGRANVDPICQLGKGSFELDTRKFDLHDSTSLQCQVNYRLRLRCSESA